MKEPEMLQVAGWIARALEGRSDSGKLETIRGEVSELTEQFPLYGFLRG